jgi:hypothetical protein
LIIFFGDILAAFFGAGIVVVFLFANFDKLVIFLINTIIIHTNIINPDSTLTAKMFIIQKLVDSIGSSSVFVWSISLAGK